MASKTPVVEAKDLHAGYLPGINILNGCSLTANQGELIGIIGPNGAGKSTLLKAIFGQVNVRSGNILLNGEDITGLKANKLVAKGVAFVPQTNNVFPSLTIEENLELGAIWRKNSKEMKESLDQVVTIFPRLGERISQRSDTLSGGERQMLAIGRAIMSKPKLLLLDEPSLGLAPLVVEQIFQTIRDLATEMRLTVLLVEQNAMGALKIADLGIVLNLGKVVAVNHAQALIEDPAVRAAYLGY